MSEKQEYISNKDAEFVETILSAKEQMSPFDRAKMQYLLDVFNANNQLLNDLSEISEKNKAEETAFERWLRNLFKYFLDESK